MTDEDTSEQRQLWQNFCKAVDTRLQQVKTIRGVSGLEHRVQAIGVNEDQNRTVVISSEANPRVAALMQVDVQSAFPDTKIIVARPIIIDIGVLSRKMFDSLGVSPIMPIKQISESAQSFNALTEEGRSAEFQKYFGRVFDPVVLGWKNAKLPTAVQVLDIVNQATQIDWESIIEATKSTTNEKQLNFTSLYNIDMTAIDRTHGVCALPLYEFDEDDWNLLLSENSTELLQDRLRRLDVMQYFFPPPDQVALAMVDYGKGDANDIIKAVEMAPEIGHPLAQPEIVQSLQSIRETVEALKGSGHIVEGDIGLEVTAPGAALRATVKIKPKEGFFTKLLARMNFNINASPRDFLPR